jgi:predicted TIM-barrel fold metal-dependent hydrolase
MRRPTARQRTWPHHGVDPAPKILDISLTVVTSMVTVGREARPETAPGDTEGSHAGWQGSPRRGCRVVTGIDPSAVTAIDVHVHVHASVTGDAVPGEFLADMAKYFRSGEVAALTVRDIADFYRQRNMAAVVFGVDSVGAKDNDAAPSNEEIAELAAENADVLIPFASIDPARGAAGVRMARRLAEHHGVRGFKFHPNTQAFYPNDREAYPLYEVIAEHGLIALFHTGHTGVGAGTRGGGGVRLKYSNPMYVDDVAVDFPDMPIILAHPSFPWQDEALSVALHKPTVHIDLSGWSPKYFPPQLIQYANTLLKEKVLFGTDYPLITPERWMTAFDKLDIKPEVRPLIMKENAARLFGLYPTDA